MKKIAMFIAAAAIAVSASAQRTTITANKAGDNIYVGVNAGAITGLKNADPNNKNAFKVFSPEFGVRVGKNFTTVFGLALDANAYFNANKKESVFSSKTFVKGLDVDLLGTANLMNLFAGYKVSHVSSKSSLSEASVGHTLLVLRKQMLSTLRLLSTSL